MSSLKTIAGSQFVAELARLPLEELKDARGDPECIICRTEFGPETEDAVRLACSHVFDRQCLDGWLSELEADQNTCPKCRTVLFERDNSLDTDITNSLAPYNPPDENITDFLDLLGGIPASVAVRLPPPSTTLSIFSGLSQNATRVLRQQYSDWFSRQTQEVQERFPNPSDLPIEPRDDNDDQIPHDYLHEFLQRREEEDEEDEAASFRLPENHQFPQLDTPEDFDRVLERISGLTEENRNELRRTRAELHAQRQRQVPFGFGTFYTDSNNSIPIFGFDSRADSNNAYYNIPWARTNNENHHRVEANHENDVRLETADDYQHFINRSALSEEIHDRLQRDLAELGVNIPEASTTNKNNIRLESANGRRLFLNYSAPSGEGRNRIPRSLAELSARMQRRRREM